MAEESSSRWYLPILLLLLGGCPLDSQIGSNCADAGACLTGGSPSERSPSDLPSRIVESLDVLFVVDDSPSMAEEQKLLREALPRFVRVLATGDRNLNDAVDFRPPKSLHLGVITTDMGLPTAVEVPGCTEGDRLGDDGRLVQMATPEAVSTGCEASYPRYLTHATGYDADALGENLGCLAEVGTEGCGIGQPLEATLKALAFEAPEIRFRDGTSGHGLTHNDGFVRDDSLLVVVVVTDRDDCSLETLEAPALEDIAALEEGRCPRSRATLHQLSRYVEGLRASTPGWDDRILFAAIAGVPPDLADPELPGSITYATVAEVERYYESVLNDPRMQTLTRTGDYTLPDACNSAHGAAKPARRLVGVARGFGQDGVVQSICHPDFRAPLDGVLNAVAKHIGPPREVETL